MSKKKPKRPKPPPPEYDKMWEAYQKDILSLSGSISNTRARAAASGQKLTGERGKAFEQRQQEYYDTSLSEIQEGTAYKTLSKKYGYNMEGQMAEKHGTVEGYEAPVVADLNLFKGGDLAGWKSSLGKPMPTPEEAAASAAAATAKTRSERSGSRWISRDSMGLASSGRKASAIGGGTESGGMGISSSGISSRENPWL